MIDTGESVVDAASRELLEETGYVVEGVSRILPAQSWNDPGLSSSNTAFVQVQIDKNQQIVKSNNQDDEDIEICWVELSNLMDFLVEAESKRSLAVDGRLMMFAHGLRF